MDKVEYDKLSWLKDLPQPTTDHSEVGYLVYKHGDCQNYINTCRREMTMILVLLDMWLYIIN